MQARLLILSALAGGVVMGTVGGLASHPVMLDPPEPTWRKISQAQAEEAPPPDDFVDTHARDLHAGWMNRTAPGRRDYYAAYESATYQRLDFANYRVETPAPLPEAENQAEWSDPSEASGAEDNAAAAQAAAQDAQEAEKAQSDEIL
jgi:hypothetical protein